MRGSNILDGHGFSVSSVNYGLADMNAQGALRRACPIVASSGQGPVLAHGASAAARS